MTKKKALTPDDFAPLPKKPILVQEDGFDKTIARLLKTSKVGVYEIKLSGNLNPSKRRG